MRNLLKGFILLTAVAAATPACLQKDTTQTIYLEPDGSVTWRVLHDNIRSDRRTDAEQAEENAEFLNAALGERHDVAEGFRELNALSVLTTMLRRELPYSVLTEARFAGLDSMMADFIGRMGATGTSTLEHHGASVTWTFTLTDESDQTASSTASSHVDSLSDGFEHCRFVLSVGRFTNAVGFDIDAGGQIATLEMPDGDSDRDGQNPLVLSLTWESAK